MTNFLDKLKKGMNIKNIAEEDEIEEPKETPAVPLAPKELDQEELEEKIEEENDDAGEIKTAGVKNLILSNVKEIDKKPKKTRPGRGSPIEAAKKNARPTVESEKMIKPVNFLKNDKESWLEPEGQLVIDVYETDNEIVIQSAIAGISPENLDISIEKDMVSIKGKRESATEKSGKNYLIEECYWGAFSREIILPTEVDSTKAEASMKNGVLTIRAPKIEEGKKKLTVR